MLLVELLLYCDLSKIVSDINRLQAILGTASGHSAELIAGIQEIYVKITEDLQALVKRASPLGGFITPAYFSNATTSFKTPGSKKNQYDIRYQVNS